MGCRINFENLEKSEMEANALAKTIKIPPSQITKEFLHTAPPINIASAEFFHVK
jgi:hypothetical protein